METEESRVMGLVERSAFRKEIYTMGAHVIYKGVEKI
jgi:hypothetical protein